MNYNDKNAMRHWKGRECGREDNTRIDRSKCLGNEDHLPCMYGDLTTPVKDCGDLAYHAFGGDAMEKELDQCREPSSQAKRRRTLHFEPGILHDNIFSDDLHLKSMESKDSLEDVISEMSWMPGFSEGTPASGNVDLDPLSVSWLADILYDSDAEIHPGTETISGSSGALGIPIDNAGLWNAPLECNANSVQNQPVQAPRNIVFKGTKMYSHTPPKLASAAVAYPFTFIKPCGMLGDTTLKDINQRIHGQPTSKEDKQNPSRSCPTSAFSGKPVVGKTKIHTEGGEGSITILRTKG